MKRPTLIQSLWFTATIVSILGVTSFARAIRDHRQRTAAMEQSQRQLDHLRQLAADAADAESRLAAWRRADTPPDPWRAMLRELRLDNQMTVRETETDLAATGWRMRLAELSGDRLAPDAIERLINHAQTREHPWRLRSLTLTAVESDPAALSAALQFETPHYRRRYQ